MKATKEQIELFVETYDNCLMNAIEQIVEYKKCLVTVLMGSDLQNEHDFKALAKQAFLYKMKDFYDHYKSIENIQQDIKDILNDGTAPEIS
jgi:hypothetical protein